MPIRFRPEPTESQLHASVAQYLAVVLKPPAMFTTFPAGGYALSRALGGIFKRNGLLAGMPDLLVFYNGRCIGLELKVGNNKLSTVQTQTIARLENAGVRVYLCRSIEDVTSVLQREGVSRRGQSQEMNIWPRHAKKEPPDATSEKPAARAAGADDVQTGRMAAGARQPRG